MLDRIRRKLFLSIKVMSSNDPASDGKESENAQQLKKAELMDILRKGSSTISGEETGMDFGRFSNAPIDAILEESRAREGVRDARMKKNSQREAMGPTIPPSKQKKLKSFCRTPRRRNAGCSVVSHRFRANYLKVKWSIGHRTTNRLPRNGMTYGSVHGQRSACYGGWHTRRGRLHGMR
jgi:hypothetical protein